LFAPETLELVGVIEGSSLTGIRTAAVSGLATRYLARADASRLVLFGAGVQAHTHLEAMCVVRSIEEVWVVSRTRERAEALAERARSEGLRSHVGEPDAVAAADIVCTCTTSPVPVFDGSQLPNGAHINAVGAFTPQTRELDDDVARRARFAVELRAAAMAEAGDILIPLESGVIDGSSIVAELPEIVGGMPVRRSHGDVTVFKSVGVAFEDLVLARAAFDAAAL
jgi:ornithine cyclodeaminase